MANSADPDQLASSDAFDEYPQYTILWRTKKNINTVWMKKKTKKLLSKNLMKVNIPLWIAHI